MRTLLICACTLAGGLAGCGRQPAQQSCVGLNPLACLAAVQVPIEPESHDNNAAAAVKPVTTVVCWFFCGERRGRGMVASAFAATLIGLGAR